MRLMLLLLVVCFGCSKPRPEQEPALYGEVEPKPAPAVERLQTPPITNDWRRGPFYILRTELSPAQLVFSTNKYVSMFTGLEQYGLGAPSHLAFATRGGPRAFTNGARLVADEMDEAWLLAWFAGAKGWTNWDVPWAIFLQRKPASMKLDAAGLHLGFRGGAEHIVMMPLYGYYKPPLKDEDYLAAHGLPSKKITTWKWAEVLTRDVLMRVRYWASAAREFPIYCEDSFSVDRADDSVTIRQRFEWISTRDDWNTKPMKLAPVPPPLGLVEGDETFPAQFTGTVMDLDLFTPDGPYKGIQQVDQYDVTLRVLKHVNEGDPAQRADGELPDRVDISWTEFGEGALAASAIGAARTAYRAGDLATYNYACSIFARAWVAMRAKELRPDYLRKHQPVHSMEAIRPESARRELPGGGQQRLIPGAPPSPFVPGIQRDVALPELSSWWKTWKTPSGDPWMFGVIDAGVTNKLREAPLNWNTVLLLPDHGI